MPAAARTLRARVCIPIASRWGRRLMSDVDSFWSKWSPVLLSILRIVVAFLFMAHGAQKLFGVPGAADHKVELMSLMGLAGCLELFGGGLLLLGLFTRPITFVLSGEMAFAYFMTHAPQGILAGAEPGRGGGVLLLRVPVPVGRRRRRVEPGPDPAQARGLTLRRLPA
jgi:putative oxidoreductase